MVFPWSTWAMMAMLRMLKWGPNVERGPQGARGSYDSDIEACDGRAMGGETLCQLAVCLGSCAIAAQGHENSLNGGP